MSSHALNDMSTLQSPRPLRQAARWLPSLALLAAASGCSTMPSWLPFFHHRAPAEAVVPSNAEVPERVRQRFDRAVRYLQSGKNDQAEAELRDIIVLAPQIPAPYIDLAIIYRRQNKLIEAEEILKSAVYHNQASAMAWTELGVLQRQRGEFKDAAASYEKAISADPGYAPAYRNLGVVADLYLGDPDRALTALEHYKQLTGEDKPVSNWIAELRIRVGKQASVPATPAAAPAPAAPQNVSEAMVVPPRADN